MIYDYVRTRERERDDKKALMKSPYYESERHKYSWVIKWQLISRC